jgi:hypothetical protein
MNPGATQGSGLLMTPKRESHASPTESHPHLGLGSGSPTSTRTLRGGTGTRSRDSLALRREAAAEAIGVSVESFDRYIRPTLPVVRLGTLRLYPVAALQDWLAAHADSPVDELERLR